MRKTDPRSSLQEFLRRADAWTEKSIAWIVAFAIAAGFVLRWHASTLTYLGAGEAFHFLVANHSGILDVYRACIETISHPPLYLILLHFWIYLGKTEILLRLFSVISGTATIWLGYLWSRKVFGSTGALATLLLLAFNPSVIALSASVRAYALLVLLFFSCLYCLERALRTGSSNWMFASAVLLYLAIFTHFSTLWFAIATGIYGLATIFRCPLSSRFRLVWCGLQCLGVVMYVVLFFVQISNLFGSEMQASAISGWLSKYYFHPESESAVRFLTRTTLSAFRYIVGSPVSLAILLFAIGLVEVFRQWPTAQNSKRRSGHSIGILLVAPFLLASGAALLKVYPYGGTRHSIYLLPFIFCGLSASVVCLSLRRPAIALLLGAILASVWYDPPRLKGTQADMELAMHSFRTMVSQRTIVLVDGNSRPILSYYLSRDRSVSGVLLGSFRQFDYGGYRILTALSWLNHDESSIKKALGELYDLADKQSDGHIWFFDGCDVSASAADLQFPKDWQIVQRKQFGPRIILVLLEHRQVSP